MFSVQQIEAAYARNLAVSRINPNMNKSRFAATKCVRWRHRMTKTLRGFGRLSRLATGPK